MYANEMIRLVQALCHRRRGRTMCRKRGTHLMADVAEED